MRHILLTILFCFMISMIASCDASVSGLQITPKVYDFGRTNLNFDKTMFFRVNNVSTTSFQIKSVTILGDTTGSFYLTSGSASRRLAAGSYVIVGVKFKPTQAGKFNVYLQISHNGTNGFERVYISGYGQTAAQISVSVSELNYGNTYVSTPKTMEIEVTNTGTSTLVLNGFSYTYPNVTQFAISSGGTIPVIMSVGSTHTIEVDFTPDNPSTYYNELLIGHTGVDANSPIKVKLRGAGVNFSPEVTFNRVAPWDMGTTAIGTPLIQDFVIKSTGIDPLTITKVEFVTNAEFKIAGFKDKNGAIVQLPQTLQPGEMLIAQVVFNPGSIQVFYDTLEVEHDGINESSPYDIAVEAEGT